MLSNAEVMSLEKLIRQIVTKNYARFRCQNMTYDIEDFCQEVWVRVLKRHFDIMTNSFVARLTTFVMIDLIRKELKRFETKTVSSGNRFKRFEYHVVKPKFLPLGEGLNKNRELVAYIIFDELERKITSSEILGFVTSSNFTPEQKQAFTLRFKYGWTYDMISEYMKRPSNTITTWILDINKKILKTWKLKTKIASSVRSSTMNKIQ